MRARSEFARAAFARLRDQVLLGPGHTDAAQRKAAATRQPVDPDVDPLLGKVRARAYTVTDADVERAKKAGHDDDAIFELTIAAAVGVAQERLQRAALAVGSPEGDER